MESLYKMFLIGKNAEDNWRIIKESEGEWLWFHLNSFPSCHVIIQDSDPTAENILEAAKLCKFYSKYKHIRNIKIVYTNVNNLRFGESIGSVHVISKRKCNYVID